MCHTRNQRKKFYIPSECKVGQFGRPKDSIRKTKRISPEERKKKTSFHRILDFCVQNTNSIHGEIKEKLTIVGILDSKADIIVITETKTGKGSNTIHVPGYKIVAQEDRKKGAGGVMILAKENIIVSKAEAESPVEEIQVCSFVVEGLLVIGAYRSPTVALGSTDKIHHGKLIDCLNRKISQHGGNYVVTGDFNLGKLAKYNFKPPNLNQMDSEEFMTYFQMWGEWVSFNDLRQYVTVPTFRKGDNSLDLCFAPADQEIMSVKVSGTIFGPAFDHHTLMFSVPMDYETTEVPRFRRVATPETWKLFRQELRRRRLFENIRILISRNFPWGGFITKEDCVSAYIVRNVREAYELVTPEIQVKSPPRDGYLSKDTVQLIRKSKRKYGTMKWAKENNMWSEDKMLKKKLELKLIKKAITFQMNRDRSIHEERTLHISEKKSENFYKFMGRILKKPISRNNAVKDVQGNLQTTEEAIVEVFNDYLEGTLEGGEPVDIVWEEDVTISNPDFDLKPNAYDIRWENEEIIVTPKPRPDHIHVTKPSIHPDGPQDTLNQIWVTPQAVVNEIKRANREAAPGPDGLPMTVFAEAAEILSEPLALLYNMVFQSSNVPESWKDARVVMLHKKNSKEDVKNYRPLNMADHIGKIGERLINSALKDHLEKHKLLDPHQHGFRNSMGTQTNLLSMWEEIVNKLETDGALVEFWSFDLTKAFDLLDHNKALNLLKKAGVTGMMGQTIQNWLCGRTQFVEMGEAKSRRIPVKKSCIQGSILGPTLWLIYIQSLLDRLKATGINYYGYADDIAIVKTLRNETDKEEFEKVLKIIEDWAEEFGMIWSPSKTQRLVMEYKGSKKPHEPYKIKFGGQEIVPAEAKAESLGLLISKKCIFTDHIKRVADKMRSITCHVRRNFVSKNPPIMTKIYRTYMQPSIDYVSSVYHPGTESLLKPITKAADSFWKLCTSDTLHESYFARIGFLEPRLRLIMNDLVFIHNMIHGRSVLDFETMFKLPSPMSPQAIKDGARFRNKKLRIPKFRLKLSRLRFSFRSRAYWNLVPREIQKMKAGGYKKHVKKFIIENKRIFLNLGLKDYNIIGEEMCKEVRRNGRPANTGRKFKKWHKPLKIKSEKTLLHPVAEKLRKNAKKAKNSKK